MEQTIVAELRVEVPNHQFRRMVVEGVMNEETSDIVDLIVDLVEEIAGDPESVEHLKNLIDLINGYLPSEYSEEASALTQTLGVE